MFNLSGSELVFIFLAALVVLGPEKLPGAIRQFARIYSEIRKMGHGFQTELKSAFDEPMREMRETADLARNAVMNPFGEDGPGIADVKPRSISESVRKMLEGSDAPATAAEVAAASAAGDIDPVLAAERGIVSDEVVIPEDGDGEPS